MSPDVGAESRINFGPPGGRRTLLGRSASSPRVAWATSTSGVLDSAHRMARRNACRAGGRPGSCIGSSGRLGNRPCYHVVEWVDGLRPHPHLVMEVGGGGDARVPHDGDHVATCHLLTYPDQPA